MHTVALLVKESRHKQTIAQTHAGDLGHSENTVVLQLYKQEHEPLAVHVAIHPECMLYY